MFVLSFGSLDFCMQKSKQIEGMSGSQAVLLPILRPVVWKTDLDRDNTSVMNNSFTPLERPYRRYTILEF